MPLTHLHHITNTSAWALWHIEEDIPNLTNIIDNQLLEPNKIEIIKSDQKKLEWLASRIALQELLKRFNISNIALKKDEHGKPFIEGASVHVSISHSYPYAAAAIDFTRSIGIDIEHIRPQIEKIQHKFLCETEYADAGNDMEKLCLYWSAKETVYKYWGKRQLIFKEQILFNPFKKEKEGVITGKLVTDNSVEELKLAYHYFENLIVCYNL